MSVQTLSRLERVELRQVWGSESSHFTPWLAQAENLVLLGEAVGIQLELESQEKEVGPFRADILCKDSTTDAWVLIENQLERTDHTHLGQLLTYAAGLKAVTIVWVAQRFTEEHRAALDWLNEISDERFNFFGLEVELWRISDSPPAPKFNIISKPNDWVRYIQSSAGAASASNTQQLQLEFWMEFRKVMELQPFLRCPKPAPRNWYPFAIGRTGFFLGAVAVTWDSDDPNSPGALRAELVLNDKHRSKVFFALLAAEKSTLEQEMGEPLVWNNPENSIMCRIFVRRSADIRNRDQWPEHHRWLREKLEKLHRVFVERVRRLEMPERQET